jgi:glycosyltransferase involved in cell wall biosynthesis
MNTKISLIIPIYNSEKFLVRCLDSILSQLYNDFEVILINDGSTDHSFEICKRYTLLDARFKVYSKENGGVSSARNFGLYKAVGSYVVFVDSDDYLAPLFLKSYMDSLTLKQTDIICQGYVNVFDDKLINRVLKKADYTYSDISEGIYELELNECLSSVWNKIFRLDIIEKNNLSFSENINMGEDKLFVLSYMQFASSLSVLDSCYYFYYRAQECTLSNKHHPYDKLKWFIETEYNLFNSILKKCPSKRLLEAANGRYVSFNKFILLWMYDPKVNVSNTVIKSQIRLIEKFYENNSTDKVFEREVPHIIALLINYKFIIRLLIRIKYFFPKNFSFFKHNKP